MSTEKKQVISTDNIYSPKIKQHLQQVGIYPISLPLHKLIPIFSVCLPTQLPISYQFRGFILNDGISGMLCHFWNVCTGILGMLCNFENF